MPYAFMMIIVKRVIFVGYEEKPERVVNFLNELPKENCERLEGAFTRIRERARQYCLDAKLSKKKEDEIFTKITKGELEEKHE